jgi:hypothetical protein
VTERYAELLEQEMPPQLCRRLGLAKGSKYGDGTAMATIREAVNGSYRASREIREAIEGRVANRIEFSGPGGEEIKAVVDAKLSVGDLVGALRQIYGLQGPNLILLPSKLAESGAKSHTDFRHPDLAGNMPRVLRGTIW